MLCIIDMQNDFVDQRSGRMAVKGAERLIPGIIERIDEYERRNDLILYTVNNHGNMADDQRDEKEKNWGQEIVDPLKDRLQRKKCIWKTYHSISPENMVLIRKLYSRYSHTIEIVGVETHKCVLATAVLFKNEFPEAHIVIPAELCLSSDMDLHEKALVILENLKMEVRGWN